MKNKFNKLDLKILYKYALNCNFIVETGSGISTLYLSKVTLENNAKVISIEAKRDKCVFIKNVEYMIGWSLTFEEMKQEFGDKTLSRIMMKEK